MDKISQGAEAVVYMDEGRVFKSRVPKRYRAKELDSSLRRSRTKREAKVMEKLPSKVMRPKLFSVDAKDCIIEMEYIDGPKVRDILEDYLDICVEIGRSVAYMHKEGIVHGDLTTSNMILSGERICMIDFGLSYFSEKAEDMAVDLHLLRQALESKHHMVHEKAFNMVLEGYKDFGRSSEVLGRLVQVEGRGRHKGKNVDG